MAGFPVLDAEPGASTVRQRALVVVLFAVMVVLLGAGVAALVSKKHPAKQTSILGYQNEVLSQFAPDGSKPVSFASLGLVSGGTPTASPDGKLLLAGSGQLVTLDGAKPTDIKKTLYSALTDPDESVAGFADGDKYVAIFDAGESGQVALAETATGAPHALGVGEYAVGDPVAPALYATVPVGAPVGVGFDAYQPVSSIEHRGIGISTTVLATSADIAKRLNIAAAEKLSLEPGPDPTGKNIAIFVVAHDGSTEKEGLAVYSSNGVFVGAIPSIGDADVFWSPSGATLFYQPTGTTTLAAWSPSSPASTAGQIALPAGVSSVLGCVWAPDGKKAMCSGVTPSHQLANWVLIDPKAATASVIDQASQPVLWLTGASNGHS